jgi:hypothetical protein
MTPEQATRLALDIGREVTELVQRRLAEIAQWDPPAPTPVQWPAPGVYDEETVKLFRGGAAERKATAEALYELARDARHPDDADDGGVKREVIDTLRSKQDDK